jgi:hypothetical protein
MLIIMTVFAALAALALAMSVGYYLGRRVSSAPSNWKRRTSRVALGKRVFHLAMLVAARRVRRKFAAAPTVELLGLRILVPLDVLRGSVTRMRSYRGALGW